MKKTLTLLTIFAAICFVVSCADDFATVVNLGDGSQSDSESSTNPKQDSDIDTLVTSDNTIRLGSFNLWISGKGTGDYEWTKRRSVLAQSIIDNGFDIFGFQEANSTIQDELPILVANLGGNYEWWFIGRDSQDGTSGEAIGLAYNPDRFELSSQHFFWLSPTPDEVSYGWGETSYHRIGACAVVSDKLYKTKFFMMVTHGPLNDEARANAAYVLIDREEMYNVDEMPSILVGDMNAARTDPAYETLCTHWEDSYETAPIVEGPIGTFQSHSTSTDLTQVSKGIDYVFIRKSSDDDLELLCYLNDTTVYDGIYPSDHCPISVLINVNYTADEVEGSGTASDPYQINSVSDWNQIASEINEGSTDHTSSTYYTLVDDIDFTGKSFVAIDTFKGIFEGNNHTMLNIVAEATGESFGPFGKNYGTIQNVTISGAEYSTAFSTCGGIAGTNEGGLIDGAYFSGTITGTDAANDLGGIVGINRGTIVNCANLGGHILADTASKSECLGGLVGQNASTVGYIINSYSLVDKITSSNNNIGGVLGICSTDSFVINCYSTLVDIEANSTFAPVVGYNKVGNLQNLYGNVDCACSAGLGTSTVGNDKKAGSVYPTTTGLLLTLDNMISGSVTVPANSKECSNFVEALNEGVSIFNDTTTDILSTKPTVTLREWQSTGSYPVFK